jgi:hypothetical protein
MNPTYPQPRFAVLIPPGLVYVGLVYGLLLFLTVVLGIFLFLASLAAYCLSPVVWIAWLRNVCSLLLLALASVVVCCFLIAVLLSPLGYFLWVGTVMLSAFGSLIGLPMSPQ